MPASDLNLTENKGYDSLMYYNNIHEIKTWLVSVATESSYLLLLRTVLTSYQDKKKHW